MREIDEDGPACPGGGDGTSDLDREPRLADPSGTGERHETGTAGAEEVHRLRQFGVAPQHRRRRRRQVDAPRTRSRRGRRRREAVVLLEDRPFERLERRPGLDADLVDQAFPSRPVLGQGVGLAPRAVEREHQLRASPLAERLGIHESAQTGNQLLVIAERELGVGEVLERAAAKLLEPRRLVRREIVVRHVGEGRPAPEFLGLL